MEKYPFQITINDYSRVRQTSNYVKIGHYFVFVEDQKALSEGQKIRGRLTRLLVESPEKEIFSLVEKPVELAGATITPEARQIDPIGCVVSDRDLYRAEQDTIYLFIAFPSPPDDLHLIVEYNGEMFADRKVELTGNVGIETFSMLLPGNYAAYLSTAGRRIGQPASFTVAEYTLAPLSGRLIGHTFNRETEELSFELAVESYQLMFDGKLKVALIDQGREVAYTKLKPVSPGWYQGSLKMRGEGPFRLRLTAVDDPERVAEVIIPGSRKVERETSVISELGQERLFSMMPEADALPVRGGYLTEGDFLATPLAVDEVVTERRAIQVNANVEALTLVCLDLSTGRYTEQKVGGVSAGSQVSVNTDAPISMVFAGCFVNGQPFEGYTTFIQPTDLRLSVTVPATIRPKEDLSIQLECEGVNDTTPVLLCVRDERLTVADTPEVSLGASFKRGADAATEGMAESGFTTLADFEMYNFPAPGFVRSMGMDMLEMAGPVAASAPFPSLTRAGLASERIAYGAEKMLKRIVTKAPAAPVAEVLTTEKAEAEPPRAEFPEVLFYGIVSVRGTQEVVIPLSDSLGTFTVEAFVLANGDWTQCRTNVVVDQPVRVDLELPPAVHIEDQVIGRLRAATSSRKARITLKRDSQLVELRSGDKTGAVNTECIETPIELEFEVKPGVYRATVEDISTGESDSIEISVGEPGKFKSYAKELTLLRKGESLSLDTTGALTMRVLPALDEPFDTLVTATAGYAHLCCEQTAAKILSATCMYLTTPKEGHRRKAEQIILAGIAREKKMLRPGKGFAMYPHSKHISEYYSPKAVHYLWKLDQLDEIPDISGNLRQAVREGLDLANQAAKAHKMERIPEKIRCIEDAYAVATANGKTGKVQTFIEDLIDFSNSRPHLKNKQHAVAERATFAYAAASLIATGDLKRGITLANQVTRQFNDQGRLYSTVDSAAAIALMIQLQRSGVITGEGRARINGQEMTTVEAAQLSSPVESIEVLDGVAAVETTRIHEEDWNSFAYAFPVKIGFRNAKDKNVKHFKAGGKADLVISLPDGYETGDIVHVALPACMSWIQGGGKVKRFTMDFAGQNELRIPVVVTSKITGKQHFAVCVRNMFKEERATSPGILTVKG